MSVCACPCVSLRVTCPLRLFSKHLCLTLCHQLFNLVLKTEESKSVLHYHVASLRNSVYSCVASCDWWNRTGRCRLSVCLSVCLLVGRVAHPAAASRGQVPQTFLIFAGHSCYSNALCPKIIALRHAFTCLHITVHTTFENINTHIACTKFPKGQLCLDTEGKKQNVSNTAKFSACSCCDSFMALIWVQTLDEE